MPKGIISQFIVAMHSMILGESCVWKSGVILTKDDTKAEVIEDAYNRQIKIRVSGKRQRDLLTVIMYELERNNDSFEKLKCKKLVPCNCVDCKSSTAPEFYEFDILQRFIDQQKDIQCRRSYDMVSPLSLLDDIRQSRSAPVYQQQNQVFISYSHEDVKWLNKFKQMLKPVERNNTLAVWSDTDINAGARWEAEIKEAIHTAKVAILLVSPAFLASDFIVENELPPILNLAASEGLTILWVPVSDSMFSETSIANYQAAHPPGRPLDSLSDADVNSALVKICKQVSDLMKDKSA